MDLSWVPKGSLCKDKRQILCKYRTRGENDSTLCEECIYCGKKVWYGKHIRTGRIDNARYLDDHFRDFIQPRGRAQELYAHVYGRAMLLKRRAELTERRQMDDERIEEARQQARDALKTMKRKSF